MRILFTIELVERNKLVHYQTYMCLITSTPILDSVYFLNKFYYKLVSHCTYMFCTIQTSFYLVNVYFY